MVPNQIKNEPIVIKGEPKLSVYQVKLFIPIIININPLTNYILIRASLQVQ